MKLVPEPTIRRFARYLRLLDQLSDRGENTISSTALAQIAKASPSQIRRDLLALGALGTRGSGYPIHSVARELRKALGVDGVRPVYIVGTGRLGLALSQYTGFQQRGFRVVGVFDNDPRKVGTSYGRLRIRDIRSIAKDAAKDRPIIAILAVPAPSAQTVADTLVDAGIRGILNLAPALIKTPEGVVVQNVDITTDLLLLGFRIDQNRR